MSDDNGGGAPLAPIISQAPRYEGEDVSPTTHRELQGWYCYGMAAEIFAVVGPGSFLPVTMEQLARENGVLWSDRSTPCVGRSNADTKLATRAPQGPGASSDQDQCIINLFGAEITTSSFAMYTFSIAVFIQALTLVSFSTVADHGNNRKRLLLIFAFTGAATAMMFILITPAIYPLGSLLSIISIACLGCSFVMLNSFLPLLTSNHPSIRTLFRRADRRIDPISPHSPFDPGSRSSLKEPSTSAVLSNRISSRGIALGYLAAVLVQFLAIAILLLASKITSSRTLPLRVILFLTGIFWAVLTVPTSVFLRNRPGPPLPVHVIKHPTSAGSRLRTSLIYLTFAWSSLYRNLVMALSLRQLRIFLLAWFLLSDAIATAGTTAILFARTTLALPPIGIGCLSITATCSGIAGSLLWPVISSKYHLPTNRTIIACLCLMEIVPIYGLLGYLPPIQSLGFLGLQQAWEIFPLAIVYGVAMGGLSSYCRSFFGQLIPPGREVAFYALFAITDKGSSAIGPAIVGRITDATGSIRPAFIFLLFLIGLPILLVGRVDEEKGRQEAETANLKLARQESIRLHPSTAEGRDIVERERLMDRNEE